MSDEIIAISSEDENEKKPIDVKPAVKAKTKIKVWRKDEK